MTSVAMSTHTSSLETEKLRVAEMFYSLQGEGRSSGCPAVFLRLQHCNLLCGRDDASWRCDTLDVWRRGQALTFAEIIDSWRAKGWLAHLAANAHLVVTGGEPLLQQTGLECVSALSFCTVRPPRGRNRDQCHAGGNL